MNIGICPWDCLPPVQPPTPIPTNLEPKLGHGGKDLEATWTAYAANQLRHQRPYTNGTLIHEATHCLNADLNFKIGGCYLTKPIEGECAFYLWGEDLYVLVPTANFRKDVLIPLIPKECVSDYNMQVYFINSYYDRDALHVMEDFVSELNGFEAESPALLRDTMIWSITLGLCMQQRNIVIERQNQYMGGLKYLIDRAIKKQIDLSVFRDSQSAQASALRDYLKYLNVFI